MSAAEVFQRIDECEAYEPLVDAVLARLNIGAGSPTYLHSNIPFQRFMELVLRRIRVLEDQSVTAEELQGAEAALFQLFSDVIDHTCLDSLGRRGVFDALRIVYQHMHPESDRVSSGFWSMVKGSTFGQTTRVSEPLKVDFDFEGHFPLGNRPEVEAMPTEEELEEIARFEREVAALLAGVERSRRLMQEAMDSGEASTLLGSPSRISRGRRRHGGGRRRARGRGNSSRYSVTHKKGKDWIGGKK